MCPTAKACGALTMAQPRAQRPTAVVNSPALPTMAAPQASVRAPRKEAQATVPAAAMAVAALTVADAVEGVAAVVAIEAFGLLRELYRGR